MSIELLKTIDPATVVREIAEASDEDVRVQPAAEYEPIIKAFVSGFYLQERSTHLIERLEKSAFDLMVGFGAELIAAYRAGYASGVRDGERVKLKQ